MIFNSIYIEEAGNKRLIVFSDGNNLIHSLANSKGKTTLLRLMLYSIGYSVPNTKHIKFENCKVECQITLDSGEVLVLCRESRDYLELKQNDSVTTYVLPSDEVSLHKIIFKANYPELINNLLGIFYFDQEKGWTLLNRGVVIGSIRFNIEELIRGIAEIDCSELYRQKETKRQDLLKYKQMFSVSKYQETIDAESNNLAEESYNSLIDSKINQCKIQHNMLKTELCRIDKVLKENKHFRNFIAEIGLLVQAPNKEIFAVTEDNIIGLNDTIDFLVAKRKLIAAQYNQIQSEISELEKERRTEEQQLSFFDNVETISEIFDKRISSIPINEVAVKKGIAKLEKEIADINLKIRELTRSANTVISSIFNTTKKYLQELGIDESHNTEKYLFTSNLKEYIQLGGFVGLAQINPIAGRLEYNSNKIVTCNCNDIYSFPQIAFVFNNEIFSLNSTDFFDKINHDTCILKIRPNTNFDYYENLHEEMFILGLLFLNKYPVTFDYHSNSITIFYNKHELPYITTFMKYTLIFNIISTFYLIYIHIQQA